MTKVIDSLTSEVNGIELSEWSNDHYISARVSGDEEDIPLIDEAIEEDTITVQRRMSNKMKLLSLLAGLTMLLAVIIAVSLFMYKPISHKEDYETVITIEDIYDEDVEVDVLVN